MFRLVLFLVYYFVAPFLLHEFGHWIMLKRFELPYKFYIGRWGIGFAVPPEFDSDLRQIKVGLASAFTPILFLIPLFFIDFSIAFLGIVECFCYALWSCIEIWRNVNIIQTKLMEKT